MIYNRMPQNIKDAFAPMVRDILTFDAQYSGRNGALDKDVICMTADPIAAKKTAKSLMELGFRVEAIYTAHFCIQSFNRNTSHVKKITLNEAKKLAAELGFSRSIILHLNIQGNHVYIALNQVLSTAENVVQCLEAFNNTESSPGNETALKFRVEHIIDIARRRVLKDKYSPEVMYTRLL